MEQSNLTRADVFEAFGSVVRALGNGRRLELVEILAQGEHSVESLARLTNSGMSTVSANLQILKKAGLVTTRKEGTSVIYSVAGDDVLDLYLAAKAVAVKRSAEVSTVLNQFMAQAPAREVSWDPHVLNNPDVSVVDVRPAVEFGAGHIPGSVNIPVAELEERFQELPRHKAVLLYCRGELCRLAREAAGFLEAQGYEAAVLDLGIMEWRASGEVPLQS